MPARFSLIKEARELKKQFDFNTEEDLNSILPRYNIAPEQKVLTIIGEENKKGRVAILGFRREFSKNLLVNTRSENIESNKVFRESYFRRRCVVLADSFYEWLDRDKKKTPYRFTLENDKAFAMAALYEFKDKKIHISIITCPSNNLVGEIHPRMPVILKDKKEINEWIEKGDKEILKPIKPTYMKYERVSAKLNNIKNDKEEILNPKDTGKNLLDYW